MDESNFLSEHIAFLKALLDNDVPFVIAGASAAVVQGVPLVTQDIDLWFRKLDHPGVAASLKRVGGVLVPSVVGNPPMFAGQRVEIFDIVLNPQGLGDWESEFNHALAIPLADIVVPVLPISRVIASKRAANRQKDVAAIPALETAEKTIAVKSSARTWTDYIEGKSS